MQTLNNSIDAIFCYDENLLLSFKNYQNSYDFYMKIYKNKIMKEFGIGLLYYTNKIEFKYNTIQYVKNNTYVDVDFTTAMRHYVFQVQLDYLKNITNFSQKFKITEKDLVFMSNIFMLKGLTSKPCINLHNINLNVIEKVNTTLIGDKGVFGFLSNQYLSPLTKIILDPSWKNLPTILQYYSIVQYDERFYLDMISNVSILAEKIWETNNYSDNYENKLDLTLSLSNTLKQHQSLHNYDYSNNVKPSIETFEILYNMNIKFNILKNKYIVTFDVLFCEKENVIELLTELKKNISYSDINEFGGLIDKYRNNGFVVDITESLQNSYGKLKNNLNDTPNYNISEICNDLKKSIKNDFNLLLPFINSLKKKNIKESLDFEYLIEGFEKFFKNCYNNKTNLFLIEVENDFINYTLSNYLLINYCWCEFFFFIPKTETNNKKSYILVGTFTFLDLNGNFNVCVNSEAEKKLKDLINFNSLNLDNCLLKWQTNNQYLVCELLEPVCKGLVSQLPDSWGPLNK